MAKTAIALIVAGTGEVTDTEVRDLFEFRWPEETNEIDLVAPVSKSLFTKPVQTVVEWFDDDEFVYPIVVNDEAMSRVSSRLGKGEPTKVGSFKEVFEPDDFKDWDEAVFVVAMPNDPDDPDYDVYAEYVEAAIQAGFPVLDLCSGLDEVRLADPDPEPEPEPEPDPEPKRARRSSRAKKPEPEPEPEAETVEEEVAQARSSRSRKAADAEPTEAASGPQKAAEPVEKDERLVKALETLSDVALFFEKVDESFGLMDQQEVKYRPLTLASRRAFDGLAAYTSDLGGASEPSSTSEEPPKRRGRGRPRENFEVSEIWDEDEDSWIPRPKGRVAKGTKWRKRHAETDEILDEGVA